MNLFKSIISEDHIELASHYFRRCDAYDRSVCTGRHYQIGEPMPANSDEARLIGKHAQRVIDELSKQALISQAEVRGIIQECAKYERQEG